MKVYYSNIKGNCICQASLKSCELIPNSDNSHESIIDYFIVEDAAGIHKLKTVYLDSNLFVDFNLLFLRGLNNAHNCKIINTKEQGLRCSISKTNNGVFLNSNSFYYIDPKTMTTKLKKDLLVSCINFNEFGVIDSVEISIPIKQAFDIYSTQKIEVYSSLDTLNFYTARTILNDKGEVINNYNKNTLELSEIKKEAIAKLSKAIKEVKELGISLVYDESAGDLGYVNAPNIEVWADILMEHEENYIKIPREAFVSICSLNCFDGCCNFYIKNEKS